MSAEVRPDYRIRAYYRNVERLVEHLRHIADEVEREAKPYGSPSVDGTPRFAYAAEQASHALTWGIANAAAYRLFHDAVHADAAEAEAES